MDEMDETRRYSPCENSGFAFRGPGLQFSDFEPCSQCSYLIDLARFEFLDTSRDQFLARYLACMRLLDHKMDQTSYVQKDLVV